MGNDRRPTDALTCSPEKYLRGYEYYERSQRDALLMDLLDADRPAAMLPGTPEEAAERELREAMEVTDALLSRRGSAAPMRLTEFVAWRSIAPLVVLGWSAVEAAEAAIRRGEIKNYSASTLRKDYYIARKKVKSAA